MARKTDTVDELLNVTHVSWTTIEGKSLKITLRRVADDTEKASSDEGPVCRECGRPLSAHDVRTGAPHLFKPVGPRR